MAPFLLTFDDYFYPIVALPQWWSLARSCFWRATIFFCQILSFDQKRENSHSYFRSKAKQSRAEQQLGSSLAEADDSKAKQTSLALLACSLQLPTCLLTCPLSRILSSLSLTRSSLSEVRLRVSAARSAGKNKLKPKFHTWESSPHWHIDMGNNYIDTSPCISTN